MEIALEEAFAAFGRDSEATELAGALLVARMLEPGLDPYPILDTIELLERGAGASEPGSRSIEPWDYLTEAGFRGNTEHYHALDNSHLGRVLESRQGLPITLAIILIQVARAMGREAVGINFPGHFLVRIDEQLVDPFGLLPVTRSKCLERLNDEQRRLPLAELFARASAQAIAQRMLNNVKSVVVGSALWHRALEVVDAQLAIAPDQPGLQLERGELWLRLGSTAGARMAFEDALELAVRSDAPGVARLVAHIRKRLDALPGADDVFH
jgi:regulator of sirC expression with transglutaminase-like and TPR domain